MTYYGPDASPHEIFLERTFIAGDFISGVGYGQQTPKLRVQRKLTRCIRRATSAVYFLRPLPMETKEDSQAFNFTAFVHVVPPRNRDNFYDCPSENRSAHVY